MLSFRRLLMIPFVGQTLIVTGLATYWSLQVGQKSSQELLLDLSTQTSVAIEHQLERHLSDVRKLGELNAQTLNQQLISQQDFDRLSHLFLQQIQLYDVSYALFGRVDGRFVDAGHSVTAAPALVTERIDPQRYGNSKLHSYVVSAQGIPYGLLDEPIDYPFQAEAWYAQATQVKQAGWTPVYVWQSPSAQELAVAYTSPVYDAQHGLVGAIAVEQRLARLNTYLAQLASRTNTTIFIMEPNGKLIANSSTSPMFNQLDRLKATQSANLLIQKTSQRIETQFEGLDHIKTSQQFYLNIQGEEQFVQISPWQEDAGLRWWTVVIVPKSKFTAHLNAYIQRATLLVAMTLIISIILTIGIVQRIKRAIDRLNHSALAVSRGEFGQFLEPSNIIEINRFSQSFNHMIEHLKRSFALLSEANETLEHTVEQRTAELKILNQKLEQLSNTDELTELPNRRYFNQYLSQAWRQSRQENTSISLIMIDIDHFKQYNDCYGHHGGDLCLQAVAKALREAVTRPADLVARYGGEEFVVVLPLTDSMGALAVAKNIQKGMTHAQIPHARSRVSAFVTLSLGVATIIPDETHDPESVLNYADQALYHSKQNGRNQISLASGC